MRGLRILLAAALGVGLTYFDTLDIGLWWDDYLMLRPSSVSDIARSFHGTWEPWAILPPFYRPLTVAYQAAVVHILGASIQAVHVLSLILIAAIAWLVGLFAARETASQRAGLIAAALYGVHPVVARSQGPWFFLQYHSLCVLIAIAALLVWQRRRARAGARVWWPIFALGTLGFAIREDMVMLVPALLVLQTARARWTRDVAAPPRRLWIAAAVHVALLALARQGLLGGFGGPGFPEGTEWLLNTVRGPIRTLLLFQPGSWPINQVASALSIVVLAGGAVLVARRQAQGARELMLTGAVLLLVFNVPLALASSSARFHMLALGGVLMLAGGCVGYDGYVRYARYVGYGVLVLLLGSLALASRAAIAPQRPCGVETLDADLYVRTWPTTSAELRAWLVEKEAACRRRDNVPDFNPQWLGR